MATQHELIQYLGEHLAYERLMLGFTFRRIHEPAEQLAWNAMFESFGVHVRNLYGFLKSNTGSRNIHANDYVERFTIIESLDQQKLDIYFFHTAKQRLRNAKFDLSQAESAAAWIDKWWKNWVFELPAPFSVHADPTPVCDLVPRGPIGSPYTTTNSANFGYRSITGPSGQ